jgi:hypothetical protein
MIPYMLKKFFFASTALLVFSFGVTAFKYDEKTTSSKTSIKTVKIGTAAELPVSTVSTVDGDQLSGLYEMLNLGALKLNKTAFSLAVKGYRKLEEQGKVKNNLLTIVDFSQPSTSKRMYIIDVANRRLLQHSLVAHGRNTGALMANCFSNVAESNKSSLGFYITSETYQGKHGLSLRLDGMERSINDNARARAIVIHGADYANEGFYKQTGYLGRSFGCPAVPTKDANKIINTIRNGSCLFIYSPNESYLKSSKLVG